MLRIIKKYRDGPPGSGYGCGDLFGEPPDATKEFKRSDQKMKKLVFLVLAMSLVASVACAQEGTKTMVYGARAGYSLSPDQLFVGAHVDLGQVIAPLRLVPNVEIGFGNDLTLICVNGDLLYDFEGTPFSAGGELGFVHSSFDTYYGSYSDTDIGLSVLGDYLLSLNNGTDLILEVKLGLSTYTPDFKLTVGYNF